MGRRRATDEDDVDIRPDEVIIAENAKLIADSHVAAAKALIMDENQAALERLNAMTRWTPPTTTPQPPKSRKPTKSTRSRRSTPASK